MLPGTTMDIKTIAVRPWDPTDFLGHLAADRDVGFNC
jgi:hypothetical protein